MYKALSPIVLKELEDAGDIVFTTNYSGEAGPWRVLPYKIHFSIGPETEHIFDCWLQKHESCLFLTHIKAAGILRKEEQGLIDAYLYLTIKASEDFARKRGAKRVIVDSYIASTAEHMAVLGFELYKCCAPYRGYKKLT